MLEGTLEESISLVAVPTGRLQPHSAPHQYQLLVSQHLLLSTVHGALSTLLHVRVYHKGIKAELAKNSPRRACLAERGKGTWRNDADKVGF